MAKGLKMSSARKKGAGDRVFDISELCKSDNGTLKCRFCEAEVQYVSAYMRHASRIPVAAYIASIAEIR